MRRVGESGILGVDIAVAANLVGDQKMRFLDVGRALVGRDLGRSATAAVRAYLLARAGLGGDRLFCSESGGSLKVRAIGSMLARRGQRVGLERCRVHPHIFRKAFVTAFLDNGGDSERLRVLAGWSSMAMLQVYADSRLERLRAAHQRAGPVDRMGLTVCA